MMSEEKIPPHIHPFNFFIVKRFEEIWRDIALEHYNDAVQRLYYLIMFLEPKIRLKLEPFLNEAEIYIKNPKLPAGVFCVRFLAELTACLHEEGYFAAAKRRMITSELFEHLEGEDAVE
ncbi:MAG: hypothetical protein QXK93_09070 [Candidatus Bathyarchaeia archaeon]